MSTPEERQLLRTLYLPPADGFVVVDVPEMRFLTIEGSGGHEQQAFADGTRWLLSAIAPLRPVAREHMGTHYVEPPLEVLWWADDMRDLIAGDRSTFRWRQMIVMADWLDDRLVERGIREASEDLGAVPSSLRLDRFDEGRCVQTLHVGAEDGAVETMHRLYEVFLPSNHLAAVGAFHEIYLSDPKRVPRRRTTVVLRQPVERVGTDP
jgi:hypothetical protein